MALSSAGADPLVRPGVTQLSGEAFGEVRVFQDGGAAVLVAFGRLPLVGDLSHHMLFDLAP